MFRILNTLSGRMVLYLVASLLALFFVGMLMIRSQLLAPRSQIQSQIRHAADVITQQRTNGWEANQTADELLEVGILRLTRTPTALSFSGALPSEPVANQIREMAGLDEEQQVIASYGPNAGLFRPLMGGRSPQEGFVSGVLEVLNVSVETAPGEWLNISVGPTWRRNGFPIPIMLPLFMIFCVAVAGAIIAQRATRPLKQMAKASSKLADDYVHEPIPLRGPSDVQDVLRTYNDMGKRLEATVSRQQGLLTAIGHDLRTPITSLRLRTEMLADPAEKNRMGRVLDELQRITEAALEATKAGYASEVSRVLDLGSLVDSICDDLMGIGLAIRFYPIDDHPLVSGRPDELGRAIRNLIENAVRYGDIALVTLELDGDRCAVIVDDEGPGIDQSQLEQVFHPLVRLETSRNKETGGHGLGLHIARSIVTSHGGEITLCNLEQRGLRAKLRLPISNISGSHS